MAKPLQRLYLTARLVANACLPLTNNQAHYLGTVLRKTIGDEVLVFNGKDGEFLAEIVQINKKNGQLRLVSQSRPQNTLAPLTLYFAPVKKAPIDQIAQKATEFGVTQLQPVKTARTIVSRVNTNRLQANAIEAAEQSNRLSVPQVKEMVSLPDILNRQEEPASLLLFCDETLAEDNGPSVIEVLHDYKGHIGPWGVITGPEGGFTDEERHRLSERQNTVPVRLGPRILKADTAAFAALCLWQAALGDF